MSVTQYVTLKNRSTKTLTGQYDGKQHTFPPGYEGTWPEYIALKFKEQNPVMGSEDYFTGYKTYLMAIVEHGDDTDPIEQTQAIERWDRSTVTLPPGTQLAIIKGKGFHPIQDKGQPAPDIRNVRTESIEPTPGFDTETVTVRDGIAAPDLKP
jgi:hypothetical protein